MERGERRPRGRLGNLEALEGFLGAQGYQLGAAKPEALPEAERAAMRQTAGRLFVSERKRSKRLGHDLARLRAQMGDAFQTLANETDQKLEDSSARGMEQMKVIQDAFEARWPDPLNLEPSRVEPTGGSLVSSAVRRADSVVRRGR